MEKFIAGGKEASLYHAKAAGSPLIVLNHFTGDGKAVVEAVNHCAGDGKPVMEAVNHCAGNGKSVMETVENPESKDFNLLCIGNLNWEHDMTPWYCPPLTPKDVPCTGGADDYLQVLQKEIIPESLKRVEGTPAHIGIAGYSLAGLFALYSFYQTDVFSRAASISGSLWFPDFQKYVFSHEMKRKPEKIYLSLGDREARTRNQYLKVIQENTLSIAEYYREVGLDVTFEMNPGNHFRDAELRSAKGILAIM